MQGDQRKHHADSAPQLPFAAAQVAEQLLAWYGRCGRDLPWRHTRDPYRIWLSEVMLQQTGVETVIPYYHRFLKRYPDVTSLAEAPLEEIIELWAGLGYYRRARNLHASAARLVALHGGRFPESVEQLQDLPGIGRSTAGAIAALAFDRPEPILDGNVRRVLCRLFALGGDPRSTEAEKRLWAWAEVLTSRTRPHDYTQAIMDLGAVICTPRRPRCPECPLHQQCQGFQQGLAEQLPESRRRKPLPLRRQVALVLWRQGKIHVCRRGLDGMLGGLWEFPSHTVDDGESTDKALAILIRDYATTAPRLLGGVRHVYSHFRLEVALYEAKCDCLPQVAEGGDCRWLTTQELEQLALHGAHQKALPLISKDKERP